MYFIIENFTEQKFTYFSPDKIGYLIFFARLNFSIHHTHPERKPKAKILHNPRISLIIYLNYTLFQTTFLMQR